MQLERNVLIDHDIFARIVGVSDAKVDVGVWERRGGSTIKIESSVVERLHHIGVRGGIARGQLNAVCNGDDHGFRNTTGVPDHKFGKPVWESSGSIRNVA